MVLLEATYPEFSLTKGIVMFAIFVGVVIAIVVFVDLMRPPAPRQSVHHRLAEMLDLPDRPTDKTVELPLTADNEMFTTKIEEYRNDFPDAR